jgi:HPt (histidine-containing phosphotransfer) domain-containing protein
LKTIEETAGGGDLMTLADAVHALKSMCANIGAARAAHACNELETLARSGRIDDPTAHIANIASEAKAALEAVAQLGEAA